MKTVSVEQLGLETGKIVGQALRRPVLVRTSTGKTLVLREIADDDVADELVIKNPRFRASVRRGRRNRVAGKGVGVAAARRLLGI